MQCPSSCRTTSYLTQDLLNYSLTKMKLIRIHYNAVFVVSTKKNFKVGNGGCAVIGSLNYMCSLYNSDNYLRQRSG